MKLQEGYTEQSLCGLPCLMCAVLCVCVCVCMCVCVCEGGVVCVHFYVCGVDVYMWVCT